MDELHQRLLDKFEVEVHKLLQAAERIDPELPDPNAVNITLHQAKRVRRECNLLVRELARERDNLHSQEADKE